MRECLTSAFALALFLHPCSESAGQEAVQRQPKTVRSSMSTVFSMDGTFFVPSADNQIGTWDLAVPDDQTFERVIIELDVFHGGWFPGKEHGVHNAFWFTRRGKWRSDTVGYVNLLGPGKDLLKQMTNLDLAKGEVRARTARLKAEPGKTYPVTYTYDCASGWITTGVYEGGRHRSSVKMAATARQIRTKGGFYQFWIGQKDQHNESPTHGWRYANLRIEMVRAPGTTEAGTGVGSQPRATRSRKPAAGPLTVHSRNPRYFDDGTGRAILLVGANSGWELQDDAWGVRYALDWGAYLDYLTRYNLNYIRLWRVESTTTTDSPEFLTTPMPYQRTGPGNARDQQPRFDLTRFEDVYFQRIRQRCIEAGKRGIYVGIMLFERHSTWGQGEKPYPWKAHPFNGANNITGVDADVDGDGQGREYFLLPGRGGSRPVLDLQEAYIKKVIDTVNDLDNVLFEVCNESHVEGTEWQKHMVDFTRAYLATKPRQHPVGFTGPGAKRADGWPDFEIQLGSNADFVAPRNADQYAREPPPNDGRKIVFADSDHINPYGRDEIWVWKSFLRGLHPQALEGYDAIPPEKGRRTRPSRAPEYGLLPGVCVPNESERDDPPRGARLHGLLSG